MPDAYEQFSKDQVSLSCEGQEIVLSQGYEIQMGVLSQPGKFSLTVGHSGLVVDLMRQFKPQNEFSINVNGRKVMTGRIEGHSGKGPATTLALSGRDALAPLFRNHIKSQLTFKEVTYAELVQRALTACGITSELVASNDANRKAITGKSEITKTETQEVTAADGTSTSGVTTKTVLSYKTIQAEIGPTWWDFLREQLDRAGLCLWASFDGKIVLSKPTTAQEPIYRIVKQFEPGGAVAAVNFTDYEYRNSTESRYAECIVYGKAGGGKEGHQPISGSFTDTEMTSYMGGRPNVLSIRDKNAKTKEQCEFLARRRIAEINRNQIALAYTIPGHSTIGIGGKRIVWCPDTIVHVTDQALGIDREYYIERLVFSRKPQTSTTIHLMRPEDMLVGTKLPESKLHKSSLVEAS